MPPGAVPACALEQDVPLGAQPTGLGLKGALSKTDSGAWAGTPSLRLKPFPTERCKGIPGVHFTELWGSFKQELCNMHTHTEEYLNIYICLCLCAGVKTDFNTL